MALPASLWQAQGQEHLGHSKLFLVTSNIIILMVCPDLPRSSLKQIEHNQIQQHLTKHAAISTKFAHVTEASNLATPCSAWIFLFLVVLLSCLATYVLLGTGHSAIGLCVKVNPKVNFCPSSNTRGQTLAYLSLLEFAALVL